MLFRRKKKIRVLLATRHPNVPAALAEVLGDSPLAVEVDVVEAISTQGAYDGLPGCALAVVDLDGLVASPGLPRETLEKTLAQASIPVTSGQEFTANPATWLEQAVSATGLLDALPPRTVMITGYAGGVGKTTLSLNLAHYVASKLRLPAAVVEVAFGASSLRALAEPELPDLYDVLTQGKEIGSWQGITLLPMHYPSARLLLDRRDAVRELFQQVINGHALTIVDATGANPFRPVFQDLADLVLVVTDPRADAIANAQVMLTDIAEMNGHQPKVVLNKVRGLGDKIALSGVTAEVKLPYVGRPERDPRLAERLLSVVYPGWRPK